MASSPLRPIGSGDLGFQESELEFLQDRARTWLEAVLKESFPTEKSLPELLADGEILCNVGRRLRSVQDGTSLPTEPPKSVEKVDPSLPKTSNKKLWEAYNNVDIFLSLCRSLGLKDMDLFSASDISESKNMKQVYLCIRALSRKAKAANLPIPDFDSAGRGFERSPSGKVRAQVQKNDSEARRPETVPEDVREEVISKKSGRSPVALLAAGAIAIAGIAIVLITGRTKKPIYYKVAAGDTLIHISKQVNKKDWHDILRANPNISNPNFIFPNEKIRVVP